MSGSRLSRYGQSATAVVNTGQFGSAIYGPCAHSLTESSKRSTEMSVRAMPHTLTNTRASGLRPRCRHQSPGVSAPRVETPDLARLFRPLRNDQHRRGGPTSLSEAVPAVPAPEGRCALGTPTTSASRSGPARLPSSKLNPADSRPGDDWDAPPGRLPHLARTPATSNRETNLGPSTFSWMEVAGVEKRLSSSSHDGHSLAPSAPPHTW